MDVALEVRMLYKGLRLFHKRLKAPCLDDPPLMVRDGAEGAAAVAAAVAGDGELNLPYCWYSTVLVVAGMPASLERKLVEGIKFFLCQWPCRRILYNISTITCLNKTSFLKWVLVKHLQVEGFCIGFLAFRVRPVGDLVPEGNLLERREDNRFERKGRRIFLLGDVEANSLDVVHVVNAKAFVQTAYYLQALELSHSVDKKVCL